MCEAGLDKDFSCNVLSHLFEMFRSNESIYPEPPESGIMEVHLEHNGGLWCTRFEIGIVILEGIFCSKSLFGLQYIHFFDLKKSG